MLNLALMMLTATLALGQTQTSDPGTRAREILEQGPKDKNPDVRTAAVVALSLVGAREKMLDTLDSMLADHDVRVRIAVVSTLSESKIPGPPRSWKKLSTIRSRKSTWLLPGLFTA